MQSASLIEERRISFSNRLLNLIIFPTEQCNFRCTYCYEDFEIGRMSPTVVAGVKRLVTRRAGDLERLQISWFGGEPLAAKAIVVDLSGFFTQLAKEHPGMVYDAIMTTNGYALTLDLAKQLRELGVRGYQVSLDGFGHQHDATRRKVDGTGTFDQIWANLLSLQESELDIEVIIRVHFMPSNVQRLDDLVSQLNLRFAGDSRFSIFFKAIEHLGGTNDANTVVYDEHSKVIVRRELEGRLANPSQAYRGVDSDYVCYASRANSLIVRANGDLAKCTVALTDPRNRVGRLLEDGTIQVDQERFRLWTRGLFSGDALELACPLSGLPADPQPQSDSVSSFIPVQRIARMAHLPRTP
jgi:uncharacterized protein